MSDSTPEVPQPPAKRRLSTRGVCAFCLRSFSKGAIVRHLETCPARQAAHLPGRKGSVHISVESRDDRRYWMHLEVANSALLADLDAFLRDIWLECCGHMSEFRAGGMSYASSPDPDWNDGSTDVPVGRVLQPGAALEYDYDFGSTTRLYIRVWEKHPFRSGEAPVVLLARNEAPELTCAACGAPATAVCTTCIWEGSGFLCEKCSGEHPCGKEMQLPVVNSPRTGMCCFTG